MHRDLELLQFIADYLRQDRPVVLLVVAESFGSSPGRRGYKMAVAPDGGLFGSIGGGIMEVKMVNLSRELLRPQPPSPASPDSGPWGATNGPLSFLIPQVHQKNSPHSSGMICSGRQTVIFKLLFPHDAGAVQAAISSLSNSRRDVLTIGPGIFTVQPPEGGTQSPGSGRSSDRIPTIAFETYSDTDFLYRETLGPSNDLYIVGGGHCALALSELASKLDFYIRLFDDRPDLNTLDKNRFAHEITIIDSYEKIAEHVPSDPEAYIVVMTIGYRTDEIVIKSLLDKDFKYFGVLGSRAKMAALIKEMRSQGFSSERLRAIRTPIGLSINSRTPEEIAVSIAAEMIAIRNAD